MIMTLVSGLCVFGGPLHIVYRETLTEQVLNVEILALLLPLLIYSLVRYFKSPSNISGRIPFCFSAENTLAWNKDILFLDKSSIDIEERESMVPFSNFDSSMVWKCMLVFLSLFLVARGLGLLG